MATGDPLFDLDALGMYPPSSAPATGTNVDDNPAWGFDGASTTEEILFKVPYPRKNYDTNGITLRITHSKKDANSGNVKWFARVRRYQDDTAVSAWDTEADTGGVATPSAAGEFNYDELTLNDSDLAGTVVGEQMEFSIRRKPSDAADTKSGDAHLIAIEAFEA